MSGEDREENATRSHGPRRRARECSSCWNLAVADNAENDCPADIEQVSIVLDVLGLLGAIRAAEEIRWTEDLSKKTS